VKGWEGSLERFEYGVAEMWSPADVWVVGCDWTCAVCEVCHVLGSLGKCERWP
jgi:hypothetical protein